MVDDDFMVAKLHSRCVSAMDGFTVVGVAHSGAEALRAAERLRPDLVLLDVYLPDMDGISVLRELRAAEERAAGTEDKHTVDALFITAARDAGIIRAALRAGALHYLIKPFNRAALQEQLRHVASVRTRFDELAEQGERARRTSTRSSGPARRARASCRRASRRPRRSWSSAPCASTPRVFPPPSAPSPDRCHASAHAATWSSSRTRAAPR